jgi:hypothetical protein
MRKIWQSSEIPDDWKKGVIGPVCKEGDKKTLLLLLRDKTS